MIRRLATVVATALILIGTVGTVGAVADPSIEELGQASVYVSPAVVGTGTPDAIARLTAVADELRAAGRPVRIVVVQGPSGAPSMRQYAAQLRHAIEFDGLVVAVAPGRATGVAGPRSQAAMTTSLRNAKVGTIADPVQRAAAAARAAAGPRIAPSNSEMVRSLLALLGMALVGGVWAAAFGIRRTTRRAREALDDRSAIARVRLDAIGARLDVLAGLPDDHARADDRLDAATRIARRAQAELDQATSPDDIPAAEALVNAAFTLLRDAEHEARMPSPQDPFQGLCRVDPAHGPGAGVAQLEPEGPSLDLCTPCMKRVRGGHPPDRRMVPSPDGGRPYDDIAGA